MYDPMEVKLNSSQDAAGPTKEAQWCRPIEDTLIPQGKGMYTQIIIKCQFLFLERQHP